MAGGIGPEQSYSMSLPASSTWMDATDRLLGQREEGDAEIQSVGRDFHTSRVHAWWERVTDDI